MLSLRWFYLVALAQQARSGQHCARLCTMFMIRDMAEIRSLWMQLGPGVGAAG